MTLQHRILLLLSIIIVAAGLVSNKPFRSLLFSDSAPGIIEFRSEFTTLTPEVGTQPVIAGSPVLIQDGLAILPGEQFELSFTGMAEQGELPYARLWLNNCGEVETRVSFITSDTTHSLQLEGECQARVVRPDFLRSSTPVPYKIVLSFKSFGKGKSPLLVVDRLEIGRKKFPSGKFDPGFWAVICAGLFPAAALGVGSLLRISGRGRLALATGVAVGISAVLIWAPVMKEAMGALAIVVSVGVGSAGLWLQNKVQTKRKFEWFILLGLTGIVLWMRWRWLELLLPTTFVNDAMGYFRLASKMAWPYDTESREPFLMWVIWLIQRLTAESELGQRLATLLLGTLITWPLFWLARCFMPILPACFVVVLYAFNPALASNTPMGLREEALPLGWLLFLLGLVRMTKGKEGFSGLLIGLGAGIAILTRLNAAAAIVPVYVTAWLIYRFGWRQVVVAGFVSSAIILPHMVRHAVIFGDPFRSMNLYKVSSPGESPPLTKENERPAGVVSRMVAGKMPSEIARTAALGSYSMLGGWSLRHSLLRLHWNPVLNKYHQPASLTESAPNINMPPRVFEWTMYLFYLIGTVFIFKHRGGWILPVSIVLWVVPISYILEMAAIREPRMLMNHLHLVLILTGLGAYSVSQVIQRGFARFIYPGTDRVRVRLTHAGGAAGDW